MEGRVFIEMEKVSWVSREVGEHLKFSLGHVQLELFVKHPEYQVGSRLCVGATGRVWDGDTELGVISRELVGNGGDLTLGEMKKALDLD